jgi:hypothetical protein
MCLYDQGQEAAAAAVVDSVVSIVWASDDADRRFTHVARTEDLATYYAWLGDVDQAIIWVLHAYQLSPTGVDVFALESALFSRIRDDPDFDLLVEGARSQIWRRVQEARDRVSLPFAP